MNKTKFKANNNVTRNRVNPNRWEELQMLDRLALILLIIGGINWGLLGIFQFDLVAFLFGGSAAIISRIVYVIVALSAIWCISLFFKENDVVNA